MGTLGFWALADETAGKAEPKSTRRVATVLSVDSDGTVWVELPESGKIPVANTTASVEPGDVVTVTIENGRASIAGNVTNISAGTITVQAVDQKADFALESAVRAHEAADAAEADAQRAHDAADVAAEAATEAQGSAARANTAANDALVQVATVEDVLGTVEWIAEHGTYSLTSDATVDPDKVYYTRTGSGTQPDPYIYTAVPEPTDEGLPGYYELHVDQAVSQYVASHLALTNAGLYVLKDDSGYKVLLSNTGMSVIDPQGHVAVTYGESISFGSDRPFSIGNEDAYVVFAPATATEEAKVIIGGNVLLGSDKTLSELMAEVAGTIVFKVTEEYAQDSSSVTLTAHVYQGGQDTAGQYPDSCFAWYRKDEGDTPLIPLGDSPSITVLRESAGYGAAIVCHFTPPNDSVLLDSDDDTLTDSQGTPVSGRTPSGDYVRIADLETTVTVFDTDKFLLVGSEGENLVSVSTLKGVFGEDDYGALDNKPQIEGVTLIGDKSFPDLGIFKTDSQGYDVADDYTLTTMDINALWANAQPIGA